jgi:hypothetical protein
MAAFSPRLAMEERLESILQSKQMIVDQVSRLGG